MVQSRTKIVPPWTTSEKLHLLEVYQTEIDWNARASKMAQKFAREHPRGYFSASECQAAFERLKSLPVPGLDITGVTHANYSQKAVIDAWIKHLKQKQIEEERNQSELELVELRKNSALIQDLLNGGWKRMDPKKIFNMLDEIRALDAKRDDQEQVCRVVNVYMNRLNEILDSPNVTPKKTKSSIPPSRRPEESPRGGETAFRSPSPSSSPIKLSTIASPLRPVAESIREARVSFQHMQTTAIAPIVIQKEEPMDTQSESVDDMDDSASVSSKVSQGISKRARGRSKSDLPTTETRTVDVKEEKVEVEESPRRLTRRSGPGGPEPTLPSKQPGQKYDISDDISEDSLSKTTESSEATPPPGGVAVASIQTDISIRGPLWTHIERKERRASLCRKSTKRSEGSLDDQGDSRSIEIQTNPLDNLSPFEQIVIKWSASEMSYGSSSGIPISVHPEDINVVSSKKQVKSEVDSSTGKEEGYIDVIGEVDDWVADSLIKNYGFHVNEDATPSSAAKRGRKEAQKDEPSNRMKNLLLSALNIVNSHKHSGIFSHPVQDRDAPNYSRTVKWRMDLHTLKKEIENGTVTSILDFKLRLTLMFANATMYNSTGHDVNTYAKEMASETWKELEEVFADHAPSPGVDSPLPKRIRTRQRVRYSSARNISESSKTRKIFKTTGNYAPAELL